MKKKNLLIENPIVGGWSYGQHLGCALMGVTVGLGAAGAIFYVGCLLTLDNKPFR